MLALCGLFSCKPKRPDYPIIPWLEYKDMVKNSDGSLILKFNFKDGDADIGNTNDEGNNFYYDLFNKNGNQWDTAAFHVGYTVPRMDTDGHTKGYEGEIDVHIDGIFPPGTLKYKWIIYDRAGHASNEVSTPEFTP